MRFFIEFVLAVIIFLTVYRMGFYVVKRVKAIRSLNALRSMPGARVKFLRSPFASLFRLSENPDAVVDVGETVFLIRFLSGRGGHIFMHFASPEYMVTFAKNRLTLGSVMQLGKKYKHTPGGDRTTSRHSVKILPKLKIPAEYEVDPSFDSRKVVPVLILNPAPNEVSYVTEQKNSIKAAFTGDLVYGQKIFTSTTFTKHAEREARVHNVLR
jgi:hypothetical protein